MSNCARGMSCAAWSDSHKNHWLPCCGLRKTLPERSAAASKTVKRFRLFDDGTATILRLPIDARTGGRVTVLIVMFCLPQTASVRGEFGAAALYVGIAVGIGKATATKISMRSTGYLLSVAPPLGTTHTPRP